jgi:hypothetical protein
MAAPHSGDTPAKQSPLHLRLPQIAKGTRRSKCKTDKPMCRMRKSKASVDGAISTDEAEAPWSDAFLGHGIISAATSPLVDPSGSSHATVRFGAMNAAAMRPRP